MTENEFRRSYWESYPNDFIDMTIEQVDVFLTDAYDRYLRDNDPYYFGFPDTREITMQLDLF